MSTGLYRPEKILQAERDSGGNANIVVFLWHPNTKKLELWEKPNSVGTYSHHDDKQKTLNRLFEPHGSKVEFITLPIERNSQLTSPSKFWDSMIGKRFLSGYQLKLKDNK